MARAPLLFHTVLAAAIFLIMQLTLDHSRSAAQSEGLIRSINCGGTAYKDSNNISWEGDNVIAKDLRLFGRPGMVDSRLQNITSVMRTLRYFPEESHNRKFCYTLDSIGNGRIYLLRASFLYGNYDNLNQPPSFVLLFNYNQWTDVKTSSSSIPVVRELTFLSTRDVAVICLAAALNSRQIPFISTLELRLLNDTMYLHPRLSNSGGALATGFGLMLSRRINYGARSTDSIRYPKDIFDRIWEANTTGPVASTNNISSVGTFDNEDGAAPPAEVMATAITTAHSNSSLSFTFEDFGGAGGFHIELHFQEVDEAGFVRDGPRNFTIEFPNSAYSHETFEPFAPAQGGPSAISLDDPIQLPIPLQIALVPFPGYPRPPLLNAIELFHWTTENLTATAGTFPGDVDAIIQVQRAFKLIGYGQGDPCTPNGYPWTWIKCNNDSKPRIIEMNLASFNLTGDIPLQINNLTSLQKIDLSHNMLSGEIPSFNLLENLEYLDLHDNKLNGTLPPLSSLKKLSYLNVAQNDLCGSTTSFLSLDNFTSNGNHNLCKDTNCTCPSRSSFNSSMSPSLIIKESSKKKYVYAISFLGAIYIVSILTLFLIKMAKHRRRKEEKSISNTDKKGENNLQGLPFLMKMFTYTEICNATLDFANFIGQGGFGKVYHGLLPSGETIAVKMLEEASKQGLKEFSTEVAILSRVRHKNLVSLIGYCTENSYMLIYEYIAKGNLRDLLYGEVESTDKPLPWTTRLHIALDASQGLEYLHTGCDPAIIHRDVKSSNILLTDKMQAKVSDFGLSRLKEGGSTVSHVSTVNVVGTAGYLDPAYNATNQLTDKSDVYSFGVVLLELICGRAPIDMYNIPSHIVDWVTAAIVKGSIGDIVDPVLANGYKVESMLKVIDVAFGCVGSDRLQRPNMSQVVQVLRQALEIEMDPHLPAHSQDVSGSSATSDGKLPTLQYVESLRTRLQAR